MEKQSRLDGKCIVHMPPLSEVPTARLQPIVKKGRPSVAMFRFLEKSWESRFSVKCLIFWSPIFCELPLLHLWKRMIPLKLRIIVKIERHIYFRCPPQCLAVSLNPGLGKRCLVRRPQCLRMEAMPKDEYICFQWRMGKANLNVTTFMCHEMLPALLPTTWFPFLHLPPKGPCP